MQTIKTNNELDKETSSKCINSYALFLLAAIWSVRFIALFFLFDMFDFYDSFGVSN